MLKVLRLEASVSEFSVGERIRKADEEADRRDVLERFGAEQELLGILGQRAAEPKRTRPVLEADTNASDIRSSGQPSKRRRHD